jgi:hypothetical protein
MVRPTKSRSPAPRVAGTAPLFPVPAPPAPAWTSLPVGAAFLALYLAWAPGVPGDKDSGEFTLALATLGLAHPTGYAFYTLLGHAFVSALHALGAGWSWAANAWSALGGAVAMALLHAFAARLLSHEGVAARPAALLALLPVAAFGLNPVWTTEATLAEVNSWHLAWVAGACLITLGTIAALSAPGREAGAVARRAALWSLYVGLGLSHHATSVLVALPLTLALLIAARPLWPGLLAPAFFGVLVPLAAWSYVYTRSLHPVAGQWEALAPGVRATWAHVTGAGYRHYLGSFAPVAAERERLAAYVYPWLAPAALALLAWPFRAAGTSRTLRVALLAAALAQSLYTFSYGVADPSSYFLPALAIALAATPGVLASWIPARRAATGLAAVAACGLLVAAWAWGSVAAERRQAYESFDGLLRSMWAAVPLRRGYVVWDDDMHYRLALYQQLEHQKPEVVVVHPRLLMDADARAMFASRHGVQVLAGGLPPAAAIAGTPAGIAAFADQVAASLNHTEADSVILFLPEKRSLRLLVKPGATPAGH